MTCKKFEIVVLGIFDFLVFCVNDWFIQFRFWSFTKKTQHTFDWSSMPNI